jgi:two-component system probable response regulator PhcQ
MESQYDYRQFAVLYVDDEERSLKGFARAFEDDFRILTAPNAQEGLKVLEAHRQEIGVLMTDQRMPGEKGVWLLERARQLEPRMIRILATAYSDMDAAIAAVNTGAIYRYVTKPWDPEQLQQTLRQALEFFMVQRERDKLLREKMSVLHNLMIADRLVSLGLLAAGLSHHIRNALVAVKTFLDLAPAKMAEENVDLNGLRNPDFWKDYYQNVQGQIDKINNLLKDLWAASESPSFQFSDRVKLHEVIAGVVESLKPQCEAKRIQVEHQIPGSLPELSVDKPKFYRLFDLLLRDELASLPAGSRVMISARLMDGGAKPEVQIQIRDNGPGLPQAAVRRLFDPFVIRTDTPAEYGIHLMACFFIVYHHGGKIEAKSQEGQGTTFTLKLPLHPERAGVDGNVGLIQKSLLNDAIWEKLTAYE